MDSRRGATIPAAVLLISIVLCPVLAGADEAHVFQACEDLHQALTSFDTVFQKQTVEISSTAYRWKDLDQFHSDLLKAMALDPTRTPIDPFELSRSTGEAQRLTGVLKNRLNELDGLAGELGDGLRNPWKEYKNSVAEVLTLREVLRFRMARDLAKTNGLLERRFAAVVSAGIRLHSPGLEMRYRLSNEITLEGQSILSSIRESLKKLDSASASQKVPSSSSPFVHYFLNSARSTTWEIWTAILSTGALCFTIGLLLRPRQRESRSPALSPEANSAHSAGPPTKTQTAEVAGVAQEPLEPNSGQKTTLSFFDYRAWLRDLEWILTQWKESRSNRASQIHSDRDSSEYGETLAELCLRSGERPDFTGLLSRLHDLHRTTEGSLRCSRLATHESEQDTERLLGHLLILCDSLEELKAIPLSVPVGDDPITQKVTSNVA